MNTTDPPPPAPKPLEAAVEPPDGQSAWQQRLLPLMVTMILVLTAFFFIASLFQLYFIHNRISHYPPLEIGPALAQLDGINGKNGDRTRLEAQRWKALVMLEKHAVEQRYHQAGVLLMARIWVRYLGFVTGMILALVGTVFILGKLREPFSTVTAESPGFKANMSTASPGLILTLLGTFLMVVTITTHHNIEVKDGPLYTSIPYLAGVEQPRHTPADPTALGKGAVSQDQKNNAPNSQDPVPEQSPPAIEDLEEIIQKRLKNEPSSQ